jgi:hypothetical protein
LSVQFSCFVACEASLHIFPSYDTMHVHNILSKSAIAFLFISFGLLSHVHMVHIIINGYFLSLSQYSPLAICNSDSLNLPLASFDTSFFLSVIISPKQGSYVDVLICEGYDIYSSTIYEGNTLLWRSSSPLKSSRVADFNNIFIVNFRCINFF